MSRPNGYTAAWAEADITYVRANYGKVPVREMAAHLGRSVKAIYHQAELDDGTSTRVIQSWTAAEDDVIRTNYGLLSSPEIAHLLGRAPHIVTHRAKVLGLKQREQSRMRARAKLADAAAR